MRTLLLAAVLLAAVATPTLVAEPVAAAGNDCDVDDVACTVDDARCDVYEKLPPFIPYVCR